MQHFSRPVCLLALFVFLFAGACTKEGVLGPQGVPGEQGATGAQGAPGASIEVGSGAPGADKGVTGDFYIDTVGVMLYGPRTASGWGEGVSMRSSTQTSMLHGEGIPAASLGNEGDFYFDDTGAMLYGPKKDGGWGSGLQLHGPAGPEGAQGPEGNANVKAYTFHTGLGWEYFGNNVYQITKETSVIDSLNLLQGALMVYVQLSDSFWYQAPFWAFGRNYYFNFSGGVFTLYSPNPGTAILPEEVIEIKLIIIQGTSLVPLDQQSVSPFKRILTAARALHRPG